MDCYFIRSDGTLLIKKGMPLWVRFVAFLTPFLYPFRPILSRYIHLHVYIIMYLTLFILCAYYIAVRKCVQLSKGLFAVLIVFCGLLVLSPDLDTGLKWIINVLIGIVLANVMLYLGTKPQDSTAYYMGAITCGIIMLPGMVSKLPVSLNYYYTQRIPFMDGDISIGPNSWAFTICLSFLFAGGCFIYSRNIMPRIMAVIAMVVFIWQLLLTASRTEVYALVFCVLCALYIWLGTNKHKVWGRLLRGVLTITMIISASMLLIVPSLIFSGNHRLTDFSFNGRMEIWNTSLHSFINMNPLQWLFGCGTGGAAVFNYQKSALYYHSLAPAFVISTSDHISTHNIYLDVLLSTGIVGSIVILFYFIKTLVNMIKDRALAFVFPLFFLVSGLAAGTLASWDFCIIIAVMEFYYLRRNNKKQMIRIRYSLWQQ